MPRGAWIALAGAASLVGLGLLRGEEPTGPGPSVVRSGLPWVNTARVGTRDRVHAELAQSQFDLLAASETYLSQVRLRRLVAKQKDLEDQGFTCVAGRVAAMRLDAQAQRVTLAVGRRQGVAPRALAVDFRGLAGLVTDVGEEFSEVMLLTDPLSAVPVSTVVPPEPSGRKAAGAEPGGRATEVASGAVLGGRLVQGEPSGLLQFTYVDNEEALQIGQDLTTSGQGDIYPKGLPVGCIVGHPVTAEQLAPAHADVQPFVNWPSLHELVVAWREPQPERPNG